MSVNYLITKNKKEVSLYEKTYNCRVSRFDVDFLR